MTRGAAFFNNNASEFGSNDVFKNNILLISLGKYSSINGMLTVTDKSVRHTI